MRMKQRLLVTVAALVIPIAAHAADINKAPPPAAPPGYPAPGAVGIYGGIGTFADMSSSTVNAGGASTNLNSVGAAIEALVGYQYKIGTNFGFTEAGVNYTNLGGSANCNSAAGGTISCSVSGPWGFTVGTAIGFNWAYPLTFIPALSSLFGSNSPSSLLPSGVTPTSSAQYAGIWADINNVQANISGVGASQWQVAPEFRLGSLYYVQNGGVFDAHVGVHFSQASFNVGPTSTAKPNTGIRAGLDYKF